MDEAHAKANYLCTQPYEKNNYHQWKETNDVLVSRQHVLANDNELDMLAKKWRKYTAIAMQQKSANNHCIV